MTKNDTLWVDFIKTAATFLVVLQHISIPLLTGYNALPLYDWLAGNVYYTITRTSVPLFFILSGYLLLGKTEPLTSFFAKRISKVLVPLIVWSIFYILWKRYYDGGNPLILRDCCSFLLRPEYYHLWFLYVIIGLYLYMPILRVIVQNATEKLLYYFMALWVFAVSIIPFVEKATHIDSKFDFKMISGYVGYLVLGYLLGKIRISKKLFSISFFTTFAIALPTITTTCLLTIWKKGGYFGDFNSYLSANIILMSAAAFLFLRYLSEEIGFMAGGLPAKFIKELNSTALGIYLIHPMILLILKKGDLGFSLSGISGSAIYSIPITAMVTFFLSFVIIYLLRRIPVVKKCVP